MIPALQADNALLADIDSVPPDDEALHLWWLGQSGFLVQWRGSRLVLDPYLSDSLTEKYAATDKPHVRLSQRVIAPDQLRGVSVVTASHQHTDHLDAATLVPLLGSNPGATLVLPASLEDFARTRLGGSTPTLAGLDDGTTCEVGGFHFTGIPAAHNDVARDPAGRCFYLGFLIRIGPWTLYHSGDTLWHPGLVPALLPARCDVMLLPINGNRPERRVAGNLNGTEAAALAKAAGAHLVIPCHYDMFAFNTETTEEFTTACTRLGQPCRVVRGGERVSLGKE